MVEAEKMQHLGLASELSEELARDRRSADGRAGYGSSATPEPPRTGRSFERVLSIGGAAMLLAVALVGPLAAIVGAAAIAVAIAAAGRSRGGVAPRDRTTRTRVPLGQPDRWWMWRVVEPDRLLERR